MDKKQIQTSGKVGSFDDCPYCDWEDLGFESKLNEEEYEEVNNRTIRKKRTLQRDWIFGEIPCRRKNNANERSMILID